MNRNGLLNRKRSPRVVVHAELAGELVPFVRSNLRKASAMLKSPPPEVSVVLVGNKRMSLLHKQFMGVAGPTDVLTFPLEVDRRGSVVQGEIYVCVPVARRRARELGTRVEHEVLLYALHGLLHLCGLDDRTDRQYNRMHHMEDEILHRLGIGAVFQPKACP